MRRFGRAWKELVAEFGRAEPAVARAVASGMQSTLYVRRYLGHHTRIGSILIMTTDGVVKAAGFRRMTERIDGMPKIGMLFEVSFGMSPKEEQKLQRPLNPHDLKLSIYLWRHVDATSRGQT